MTEVRRSAAPKDEFLTKGIGTSKQCLCFDNYVQVSFSFLPLSCDAQGYISLVFETVARGPGLISDQASILN